MPGREYQFRVYAKNDMGLSPPSESPKWLITTKKGLCPTVYDHHKIDQFLTNVHVIWFKINVFHKLILRLIMEIEKFSN